MNGNEQIRQICFTHLGQGQCKNNGAVSRSTTENDNFVTELKLLCLKASDAKQTNPSESEAEKGLIWGQARRMGDRAQET